VTDPKAIERFQALQADHHGPGSGPGTGVATRPPEGLSYQPVGFGESRPRHAAKPVSPVISTGTVCGVAWTGSGAGLVTRQPPAPPGKAAGAA
jgi:hypothetical protein